jgi:hypothetical protein
MFDPLSVTTHPHDLLEDVYEVNNRYAYKQKVVELFRICSSFNTVLLYVRDTW